MIARALGVGFWIVLMLSSSFVWAQVDTDGDTISDVDEGVAISRDSDKDGSPDYRDKDSDGDGIPDAVEAGDADLATPPRDTDKDGIPDYLDVDSDNDRLPDALEDANGNGVVDFDETNPLDPDSDHDGLKDGDEDPNLNGQVDAGEADPRNPDSDGDGFRDGVDACPSQAEDFDGLLDMDGCPETDADGDGIDDTVEQGHACLDPLKADTDSDGLKDGAEDRDGNGVVDPGESDPCKADTDGDGIIDGNDQCPTQAEDFDGDRDRDGCPDSETYPDAGGDAGPDALPDGGEADRDHDGIPDRIEVGHRCLDPDRADTDGDGRLDGQEDTNHDGRFDPAAGETDPCVPDIDPVGGMRCHLGRSCPAPPLIPTVLFVLGLGLGVLPRRGRP